MQEYNTINLLACKDVVVNKFKESDNLVVIKAQTKKLKAAHTVILNIFGFMTTEYKR